MHNQICVGNANKIFLQFDGNSGSFVISPSALQGRDFVQGIVFQTFPKGDVKKEKRCMDSKQNSHCRSFRKAKQQPPPPPQQI